MHRPLSGIRVIAVEQYGAGPYGSMLLADMGATVIKVENAATGGDVSRATGPHFLGEQDSQFFQTFSKGKQSASIDLKSPEGRVAFNQLLAGADALINNLRGDQPAKLGLTYDAVKDINPRLVCAHLSAYGRGNSRETWPGYDYLMQAEAGFMGLSGEPDAPPTRLGVSMVDFMTGTMMAFGTVSTILGARATGIGCDVDVALFDTAVHQLSYPATWYLNAGDQVQRLPRGAHPSIAPSQSFRTKDGWAMLMCQTPKFWEEFCRRAGRPDLLDRVEFKDIPARRRNRQLLSETLDDLLSTRTTAEWLSILGGHVPFAPITSLDQALDNPFVAEIGMVEEVDHPDAPDGRLRLLSSPIRINGERPRGRRAPKLGERTE
ncbi:CaiB/BaiF CoA transferase family protein [Niveispirillum cyanobacteriorum]|uniref:CoA transferase n=1 Tax=Niveispirillum cyanobacteriorum TaxID=1612173 RepID=A0A2K9NDK0_9PROT|nr:CoA transferase [Niveispirillum cyanobacteriorum]AUN31184.1 CoA transferase [Niveispirillum cyanobacteriorum]GGE86632.1 CoA transferase [Niveispirillum cyanobacteriorum]